MKRLIIVASALALVAGCKTLEELRREEIARATEKMRTEIEQLVRQNQYEQACSYVVPQGSDEFVRSAIRRNFEELVGDVVCPAWADFECKNLNAKVSELVSANKFGEAREFIWCLPKTGKSRVDSRVAVERHKLLSGTVNMSELDYARKFMFDRKRKAVEAGTVAEIVKARKDIAGYPQVATYTKKLDEKLKEFSESLEMIGVKANQIDYILTGVRRKIADSFVDERGTFKEKEGPDTSSSFSKWADLKEDLAKYGCSEQQIKEISGSYDSTIKKIVDAAVKEAKGPAVAIELGTSAMKERLERSRSECMKNLLVAGIAAAQDDLVKEIKQLISAKKFVEARKRILEAKSLGDVQLDYEFYRIRIATLNTLVNPDHSDAIIAEMKIKFDTLLKEAKSNPSKFDEAYEYLTKANGIDDSASYEKLLEALRAIREGMKSLAITDAAVAGYVDSQVKKTLEKLNVREFKVSVERDHRKLAVALNEFARLYGDEVYDALAGRRFAGEIYNSVVSGKMPTAENRSYSTARANLIIDENRSRMIKMVEVHKKEWRSAREAMDARIRNNKLSLAIEEIDHAGEICAATKAIELQLCDKPEGADGMGPVLGEFVRIMRKWQSGGGAGKMSDDEALSLLSASIYLNDEEVFDRALENLSSPEVLNEPVKSDPRKRTALLAALEFRRWAFVSKLTEIAEIKVDGSIRDGIGNSIMHYLAEGYSWKELERFKEYVSIEATTNNLGETALFNAARMDNGKAVEALVELIVDEDGSKQLKRRREFVNTRNAKGETAMSAACAANACDAMEKLAAAHSTFGGRDLAAAAKEDCLAAVKWLVAKGVSVNWIGSDGVGVMSSVPPGSKTEKYLVRQGGVKVIRETEVPTLVSSNSTDGAQKTKTDVHAPVVGDKKGSK